MGGYIAPIDHSGTGPAKSVDAGMGPLRIWPGGLCLSRAVGDFDVGDTVVPFPYISQVGGVLVSSLCVEASTAHHHPATEQQARVAGACRTDPLPPPPASRRP